MTQTKQRPSLEYLSPARRDVNTQDRAGLVAVFYDHKRHEFLLVSEKCFFKGMNGSFGPYDSEPDISVLYSGMNKFDRALQYVEQGSLSVGSYDVVPDIIKTMTSGNNIVTTDLSLK